MLKPETLRDEIKNVKKEIKQRIKEKNWLEVAVLYERLTTLEFVRDWNED